MSAKISLRYLLSLTPAIFVIIGNIQGGWWTLGNTIYTMVLLIAAEHFMQEDKRTDSIDSAMVPNFILAAHVMLHTLSIFLLLYGIYTGILVGKFIWFAALSTGIASGIEGINAAHELIHRRKWYSRLAGIWNLVLVNYGHFYIEHIKGHHKWVGTLRDPATARFGESYYKFFRRTVPQQFKSALLIETNRVEKSSHSVYLIYNFVVRIVLIQILLSVSIFYFLGWVAFLAYILQSYIAISLLEYVNYIEHYGLSRSDNEKVDTTHSWQSDMPISRFALIELSRHSDHHTTASKPFYELVSHENSPVLPNGYFASFYYAFIPPLWFKMVNPVLEEYWEKQNQKVKIT